MDQAAINALYARAEIFNKLEETTSLLNPEEAEIVTIYAQNLLKTRPIRRPESCPRTGQFEPGLHNVDFQEPGLHAPELTDTNCGFCVAGNPRLKDKFGYYHEINIAGECIPFRNKCREQYDAQN